MILPVIERELRTAARHPLTYYLRVLGAAGLLAMSLLAGSNRGWQPQAGPEFFAHLHALLFGGIWVLVPLITADCISRERREGTLGLLFLTPLRPWEVLVAKCSAHGLRALTFWLAALPVLTLPFLLGGIGWKEAVLSAVMNFSAICGGLAAGIVASAWSKVWHRALLAAFLLAALCFLLLEGIAGSMLLWNFPPARRPHLVEFLGYAYGLISNLPPNLNFTFILMVVRWKQLLWDVGVVLGLSLLVLTTGILLAGRRTGRVWQEEPPSARKLWLLRMFCSPLMGRALLRSWMARKLEVNPIGWLEQRRWSGRLVMWSWMAAAGVVYLPMVCWHDFRGFQDETFPGELLTWLLAGSLALVASGSFRREREIGVLELLLVSPLGEKEIIWGRVRGLWGQFFPAVALLSICWGLLAGIFHDAGGGQTLLFCFVLLLVIPVIGLYFSLRFRGFLPAFLLTMGLGVVVPKALYALVEGIWPDHDPQDSWWVGHPAICVVILQVELAAACAFLLQNRLKKRTFVLEQAAA